MREPTLLTLPNIYPRIFLPIFFCTLIFLCDEQRFVGKFDLKSSKAAKFLISIIIICSYFAFVNRIVPIRGVARFFNPNLAVTYKCYHYFVDKLTIHNAWSTNRIKVEFLHNHPVCKTIQI